MNMLLLQVICLTSYTAQALAADKEQLVKAAFIYNFTKFISWPDEIAINARSAISICIIGSNALGDASAVFKQASTSSLSIDTKMLNAPPSQKGDCHIAYVSNSEAGKAASIIQALKSTSTLSVSDIEGFAAKGGNVEFTTDDNKVKLIVNKASAEQAGLKVDAQLLEIARKVIQ